MPIAIAEITFLQSRCAIFQEKNRCVFLFDAHKTAAYSRSDYRLNLEFTLIHDYI